MPKINKLIIIILLLIIIIMIIIIIIIIIIMIIIKNPRELEISFGNWCEIFRLLTVQVKCN